MTKAVVHRNRCLLCIHPFAVRYPFLYDGEQLPELQARPKKARRGPKVNARRGELGDCALHIADQLPQRDLLLGTASFGLLNEVFPCLGNASTANVLDGNSFLHVSRGIP